MTATSDTPIVCDMTAAVDTPEERLAEYQDLFRHFLTARERTEMGIRFRLRAEPGVADHVRDLVDREKACCAFFDFTVTETGDEIIWDSTVVDDPVAHQILDEYYRLPETATQSPEELYARFADQGLNIVIDDNGILRPATKDEIGIPTT